MNNLTKLLKELDNAYFEMGMCKGLLLLVYHTVNKKNIDPKLRKLIKEKLKI